MSTAASHRGRDRRPFALAGLAALSSLALLSGSISSTLASWTDQEFVHAAAVGTLDCSTGGLLSSDASGRLLAGRIAALPLDAVVGIDGVAVHNDGTASTAVPGTATALGDDAYRAALDVGLLAIPLLSAVLALPLDQDAGVYNQYARATGSGTTTGASGAVTDGGAIDTELASSPATPNTAAVRLSELPGLGPLLSGVTELELGIGAVAGRAWLEGCEQLWTGQSPAAAVHRDYIVAGLDLDLTSPLLADLGALISTEIAQLSTTLNGLVATAETALKTVVENNLVSLVTGLLSGLINGANTPLATVDITLDLTPVTALLTAPLTDGVVTVDLSTGSIGVDIAALFGEVYETSDGLNGLSPNTPVLTPQVLTALLNRVDAMIGTLLDDVDRALVKALYDARVDIDASVRVSAPLLGNVARIDIGIDARLGTIMGQPGYPSAVQVTHDVQVLNPLIGALLNDIVNGLTSGLLGAVTDDLVPLLSNSLLGTLVTPGLAAIGETVGDLTDSLTLMITALGPVLSLIGQLVSVTVNSQPDMPPAPAAPILAASAGQYFVSALRIGVVDGTGAGAASLLNLFLASASVGPVQAP